MNKIRDMEILLKVVEQGNFSNAAQSIGLTPAMIGRRIAAMEKELGFALFNRSTRRMELTVGGRTYHEGCQRIVSELADLEESVTSSYQKNPHGLIRLSAPDALGSPFFVDAIKEFREQYPDIRFDMQLSNLPLDLVKDQIDLSIRFSVELKDASVVATKLGMTSFVLVASQDYIDKHGKPQSLEDLKNHDCVHMGESKYGDFWKVIVNGKLTNFRQPWAFLSPNTDCLIHAALEGIGIAMMPKIFVKSFLESNKLVFLNGIANFPEVTIYCLYPTKKYLPYRVNLFLHFLKKWAPDKLIDQ